MAREEQYQQSNYSGEGISVNEFNAAAGVNFRNGLELSVYGRNLTNDRYLTAAFNGVAQPGSVFGFVNQPRTYGASARFKF